MKNRNQGFIFIWLGQTLSFIGSEITRFSLLLWLWQSTQIATPIGVLFFSNEILILAGGIFAGIWVDHFDRKKLLIVSDGIIGIITLCTLIFFLTNRLEVWYLYFSSALTGFFSYLQALTFSTSQTLIIANEHRVRFGSLSALKTFGTGVIAPALAGFLYPRIGIVAILILDLFTFSIAFIILLGNFFPTPIKPSKPHKIWQNIFIGFEYISRYPSLIALQLFAIGSVFFDNLSLIEPLILARTSNNATILSNVFVALGLGGFLGAVGLGVWGGPQKRIQGLLWGRGIIFSLEMLLGISQSPIVWMVALFTAGTIKPTANSCEEAIWLSKVPANMQGRVFAASNFSLGIFSSLGFLLGGILSDRFFEPAMTPNGFLFSFLGSFFDVKAGSGMGVQFTFFSAMVVVLCIGSYALPSLRNIDKLIPDQDESI